MKGCTARRYPGYETREYMKEMANRHNNDKSQHPQVFRQVEEELEQMKEAVVIFDKKLVSPEVYRDEPIM